MAFAATTRIGVSTGETEIDQIKAGDDVLAGGEDLQWAPTAVTMIDGGTGIIQVTSIRFSEDASYSLLVSPDQVFLRFDKDNNHQIMRAVELTPGDRLVSRTGEPLIIISIESGAYADGINNIAVGKKPSQAVIEGHLLIANGVVAGDHYLNDTVWEQEEAGDVQQEGG